MKSNTFPKLYLYCGIMVGPSEIHFTITFTRHLEASYKLDEILDLHRGEYNLPAEASRQFIGYALQYCQACNLLYNWENDKLFNVTYKHHALLHLAFGSEYESPRLGCGVGWAKTTCG